MPWCCSGLFFPAPCGVPSPLLCPLRWGQTSRLAPPVPVCGALPRCAVRLRADHRGSAPCQAVASGRRFADVAWSVALKPRRAQSLPAAADAPRSSRGVLLSSNTLHGVGLLPVSYYAVIRNCRSDMSRDVVRRHGVCRTCGAVGRRVSCLVSGAVRVLRRGDGRRLGCRCCGAGLKYAASTWRRRPESGPKSP